MALLTDAQRFKNEQEECLRAWNLLKKIPEYKNDYKLMEKIPLSFVDKEKKIPEGVSLRASLKNKKFAKALEEKWGFFPLANPNEEKPNFEFLCHFSNYSPEVDRFKKIVDFGGLEYFDRNNGKLFYPSGHLCTDEMLPGEISVKINPYAPVNTVLKEIKSELENIKKTFRVKTKNARKHDALSFVVCKLRHVGLNNKEIHNLLFSPVNGSDPIDNLNAHKKKVSRRISSPAKVTT